MIVNRLRLSGFMVFFAFLSSFLIAQPAINTSKLDIDLAQRVADLPGQMHPVVVMLEDYVDVVALDEQLYLRNTPAADRPQIVISRLRAKAEETQGPVLNFISSLSGVDQNSVTPLWIANGILLRANSLALAALSNYSGIDKIYWDAPVELHEATKSAAPQGIESPGGREPGHDLIAAPFMWKKGYTGYGLYALIIDTGTDVDHVALQGNYKGRYFPNNESWFDPGGNATPEDCNGHGTHVTGTVVGVDPVTNDTIGVAPEGLWMASPAILCRPISPLQVSQWAMDPDGDPNTNDAVHVINNSWGIPGVSSSVECNATYPYLQILISLEAAGVAVVFSSGNDGPGASTVNAPGNINHGLVNSFTVGATTSGGSIANFSSRGPSECGGVGSLLIKPEVSGPGVGVRSSIPGNGYAWFGGTSMAAPHVSGAILLLKQAFPNLTGKQIKEALYFSAVDAGVAGEDNLYGMGVINLEEAYNYLINQGFTPVAISRDNDATVAGIDNVASVICDSLVQPIVTLKNSGLVNLTSAEIAYSLGSSNTGVLSWTGNLNPGQSIPVVLPIQTLQPGVYQLEVEVTNPNGVPDDRPLDNELDLTFSTINELPPITSGSQVCSGGDAVFSGTGNGTILRWYDAPSGGNVVGEGQTFILNGVTTNTTLYAAAVTPANTGKPDNSGNGSFDQLPTGHLIFDAVQPFTLKSVFVYSQGDGVREISIQDDAGTVIADTSMFVGLGPRRITFDWKVPQGNDFSLRVSGSTRLFKSESNINYPYVVPGVLSIKKSSADNGANKVYPYFYDWEIDYESPCGRTATTATISPGNVSAAFSASSTTVDLGTNPSVSFTDNSTGATKWLWDFGDGNSSVLQNPVHSFQQPGTYQVVLKAEGPDGCSDAEAATIVVTGTVSLEDEMAALGEVKVFPNPSTGRFTLALDLNATYAVEMAVFNLMGQKVSDLGGMVAQADRQTINLEDQKAGIYLLRIKIGDFTLTKKLFVTE